MEAEQHLYALALSASRIMSPQFVVAVACCWAINEAEAIGKGVLIARQMWPVDQFMGHQTAVMPVPMRSNSLGVLIQGKDS